MLQESEFSVSGSAVFQASCVSRESLQKFYLNRETFLRFLAPEGVCLKMT